MKEIWHNLDGLQKNKELWNYVMKFELIGRKYNNCLPFPF